MYEQDTKKKESYDRLVQLLNDPRKLSSWRMEIGKQIDQCLEHDRTATYGKKQMDQLITKLKSDVPADRVPDSRGMYSCLAIYQAFGDMDSQMIEDLDYSKLKMLVTVKDAAKRNELMEQARSQKWSAKKLQAEVSAYQRDHGGRGPRMSRTEAALKWLAEVKQRIEAMICDDQQNEGSETTRLIVAGLARMLNEHSQVTTSGGDDGIRVSA